MSQESEAVTSPSVNLRRVPPSSTVSVPPHSVERTLPAITPSGMGRVKLIALMGPGLAELSIEMVSSLLLPTPISSGDKVSSTLGGCGTPAREMPAPRRKIGRKRRNLGRDSLGEQTEFAFIVGK